MVPARAAVMRSLVAGAVVRVARTRCWITHAVCFLFFFFVAGGSVD
jgi:hypothetical protein